MFTLVGYSETLDTAAVLAPIAGIADQHIRVEGDNIIIPELSMIAGVFAIGLTLDRAQLQAPSLRARNNLEIAPLNRIASPASPTPFLDYFASPIPLVRSEFLTAQVDESASGAELEQVFVWLSDGPVTPVKGDIRQVQATGVTTLVPNAWSEVPLTFSENLPAGRYNVVGLRAESGGMVAARLVFVDGRWRPGVIGYDDVADVGPDRFRFGNAGVFGSFVHDEPPQIECLSREVDTSETFILDLIKVS